jgi:hypothetical protein
VVVCVCVCGRVCVCVCRVLPALTSLLPNVAVKVYDVQEYRVRYSVDYTQPILSMGISPDKGTLAVCFIFALPVVAVAGSFVCVLSA